MKMSRRWLTGVIVMMLATLGMTTSLLCGCTPPSSGSSTPPVVSPGVNTAPEPTESTDFNQTPQEESESVHATGTP
jgi:hypothetical protein